MLHTNTCHNRICLRSCEINYHINIVHDDHDYYHINTLITYDILIYYVVRLISKLDPINISN